MSLAKRYKIYISPYDRRIKKLKTINIQELYFLKKNAYLRVLVQDFWENFLQRKESFYTYTYAKDT